MGDGLCVARHRNKFRQILRATAAAYSEKNTQFHSPQDTQIFYAYNFRIEVNLERHGITSIYRQYINAIQFVYKLSVRAK